MNRFFKGFVFSSLLIAMTFVMSGCGIDRVTPGYAGIVVDEWGNDSGVHVEALPVGRIIYNPIATSIYKFPTYIQHITWDMYGSIDESFVINSTEGSIIEFDVAVAVRFTAESAPTLFEEFRATPDRILNGYVRTLIEGHFNNRGSTMRAVDIVGEGKMELQDYALRMSGAELKAKGIELEFVRIIGEMRMDEQVTRSINAVLTAAQQALEARNRVAQAEAEADQRIARARGDSLSLVIEAGGQAEANRLLAESLTQTLVDYQGTIRWNGVLPQVTGGGTPIIDFRD